MSIFLHRFANGFQGLTSGESANADDESQDSPPQLHGRHLPSGQWAAGALTGVIDIRTEESVDPLNCSVRSRSPGRSNSTILCGLSQPRAP